MLKSKAVFAIFTVLYCLNPVIQGLKLSRQWSDKDTFDTRIIEVKNRLLVVGLQNNSVVVNNVTGGTNHPITCTTLQSTDRQWLFDSTLAVTHSGIGQRQDRHIHDAGRPLAIRNVCRGRDSICHR